MSYEIPASMREALKATRAGNPIEATRLIQAALSGGTTTPPAQSEIQRLRASKIDRMAETVDVQAGPLDKLRRRFKMPKRGGKKLAVPEGAQWLDRSHVEAASERAYRLYIPNDEPRGLILMLHGCTQHPEDFAVGTGMTAIAETHGFLVAYPAQPKSANAHACWNWFEPAHQQRDTGEPSILAGIVRSLTAEYSLPDRSTMVAGLSAGGAMAAVMAQAYPELFGAAGIHSGLACGAASDVASAFAAMQRKSGNTLRGHSNVPTFIIHGSADSTVHPGNADALSQSIGLDSYRLEAEKLTIGGRSVEKTSAFDPDGGLRHERWMVSGAGHAWSGGQAGGSFTDTTGPDASAEMVRFFRGVAGI